MNAYRAIYPGPQRQNTARALSRTERGAMAYSEITDGTVEEYEAIESTVMDRVASGACFRIGDRFHAGRGATFLNVASV